MTMPSGSDRKTPYFEEKGRPEKNANEPLRVLIGVLVLGAVLVLLAGVFALGMSYGLAQSCEGYLVGSVWRYECYNEALVSVCLTPQGVAVGEGLAARAPS